MFAARSNDFKAQLRAAGLSAEAIDAAWPSWWSDSASASPSAIADLRLEVARRLGLAPSSVFGEKPAFLWRHEARFKRLAATDDLEAAALTSFGTSIGRTLAEATREEYREPVEAAEIRTRLLVDAENVNAENLLNFCWSSGIPMVQLRVFPLRRKRMTAMTVPSLDRVTILLGHEVSYPAVLAFTVAHEIAHIAMGHLWGGASIVDLDEPNTGPTSSDDPEEIAADRFALELLTGSPTFAAIPDRSNYSATDLAQTAVDASPSLGVEAGVLAMCIGHATGRWQQTYGALKMIPPGAQPVGQQVNTFALRRLDLSRLSNGRADFLRKVIRVD